MDFWLIWLLLAFIAVVVFRLRRKKKKVFTSLSTFTIPVSKGDLFAKPPLNKAERLMYHRLQEALPEYVVLSQVSLTAMMTSLDIETRNRFEREVATFVVCTRGFSIAAIVDLENPLNGPRQVTLAEQERLFKKVGYTLLRYKRIPEVAQLRTDFGLAPSLHPAHIAMQGP